MISFRITDDKRPIQLKKIVLGYQSNDDNNCFKFDMFLNYKLIEVIKKYSVGKPIMVEMNNKLLFSILFK